MDRKEIDNDMEALKTPTSRFFLRPEEEQIWSFAMGLRYPIDVQALKEAFSNSIMIKHPRFCSLLVRDHCGEYWRRTHVNIDDHFIIHHEQLDHHPTDMKGDDQEATLNEYLADWAVSNPLSKDKPLWEVHVLMGLNCIVLRVHHAIGDGVSMMSIFSACFGNEVEKKSVDDHGRKVTKGKRNWTLKGFWGFVETIWLTLVFSLQFVGRSLWVKDKTSVLSGGDGVELWPRKVVTAKFKLEDFKFIKKAIPNATINDVLLGIVSSGLSKYLGIKSPNEISRGIHLTATVAVNLRAEPFLKMSELMETKNRSSSWGNKVGLILLPIHCRVGSRPLDHVRKMKAIMDKKKQSYTTKLTHKIFNLATFFLGLKVTSQPMHKVYRNTSLTLSNLIGPPTEMAIANNYVTYFRANISSSTQAIVMHMVSYAGNIDLQVLVAKDIISDPEFLRDCFQDSLLEMMEDMKLK